MINRPILINENHSIDKAVISNSIHDDIRPKYYIIIILTSFSLNSEIKPFNQENNSSENICLNTIKFAIILC